MAFRTVTSAFEFEDDPVKGSRFLAWIVPCDEDAAAQRSLAEARAQWSDASHHCWAYHLRDGRHRSSDDGEPGGSAGRPILAQIEGHDVTDVMVIVVRWFGGTKLGVGGLIRAYGGCAGRGLDRAPIVEVVPKVSLSVVHDYDDTGAVHAVLGSQGLAAQNTTYDARVTLQVSVPEPQVEAVAQALRDRTSGRAQVQVVEG